MPIAVTSQRHFRECQKIKVCYICGKPIEPHEAQDVDHLPAKGIFLAVDRLDSLVLPVHRYCNGRCSDVDKQASELFRLLHRPESTPERIRVHALVDGEGVPQSRAIEHLDLDYLVKRWVRGFHAALYKEYIGTDACGHVYFPFPKAASLDEAFHTEMTRLAVQWFTSFIGSEKQTTWIEFEAITANRNTSVFGPSAKVVLDASGH